MQHINLRTEGGILPPARDLAWRTAAAHLRHSPLPTPLHVRGRAQPLPLDLLRPRSRSLLSRGLFQFIHELGQITNKCEMPNWLVLCGLD